MERPIKIVGQVKKKIKSVTYGSSFYRHMLDQGPVPDRLRISITDPWPGDAQKGQLMVAGQPNLFDFDTTNNSYKNNFLTHEWLRDLRALGTDMAKRKAVSLIRDWINSQEEWDEESWRPEILGARLSNWIAFYDFYGSQIPHSFERDLFVAMVRQFRHLMNAVTSNEIGYDNLQIIKGLIYGGLGLIDAEKALGIAFDLLDRQLNVEILPDGGHISRNPEQHANILRSLIEIRSALCAGQMDVPPDLDLSITRMVPVLKFFKHGDGCLALFHGAQESSSLQLDATLTMSEAKGRALKCLPHTGYERVTAGRSLLIIDTAIPAPKPYDKTAHAGLMSFEFSVGKERIITNCGASPSNDDEWQRAMAASAAHNTIIYRDKNACELLSNGGIGNRKPKEMLSQRYEQDGLQVVEMSHDGYFSKYKVMMRRSLGLTKNGEEIRGRDIVSGEKGSIYAIRWHIHPKVNVSLANGGVSALLRTSSGHGWRLRIKGADLALENSVYCGNGSPRRTFQLRASGSIKEESSTVEWTLTREKTKKGK